MTIFGNKNTVDVISKVRSCWGRLGPKSSVPAVFPRRREETHRESRRVKTEGEGWRDGATGQGTRHLDFRLGTSRTVRACMSVVLRHPEQYFVSSHRKLIPSETGCLPHLGMRSSHQGERSAGPRDGEISSS